MTYYSASEAITMDEESAVSINKRQPSERGERNERKSHKYTNCMLKGLNLKCNIHGKTEKEAVEDDEGAMRFTAKCKEWKRQKRNPKSLNDRSTGKPFFPPPSRSLACLFE
jgi:hypothetical protein